MVKFYRRTRAPRSVKTYRKAVRKTVKPKDKAVSVMVCLAAAQNNARDAASIQQILTIHAPGAVLGWQGVSYNFMTGALLRGLFTTAFENTGHVTLTGITIRVTSPETCTNIVAYRDLATNPLRVMTGTGKLKCSMNFKDGVLPNYLVLISEQDANYSIRASYKVNQVRSSL